jgi:hypothetical protein
MEPRFAEQAGKDENQTVHRWLVVGATGAGAEADHNVGHHWAVGTTDAKAAEMHARGVEADGSMWVSMDSPISGHVDSEDESHSGCHPLAVGVALSEVASQESGVGAGQAAVSDEKWLVVCERKSS